MERQQELVRDLRNGAISNYLLTKKINVKNFHGGLTTVVRAQNDISKTANITDTIFDRTTPGSTGGGLMGL